MELDRVGAADPAGVGPRASAMFDLSQPPLDFVSLGRGLGVAAERAETAEAFGNALERAFAEPGPHLIEAILPATLS
ncbi:MAG TPA: thiamine pyrophosphate-dependent enzyme, partial [Acidimicrobiales bacterium]